MSLKARNMARKRNPKLFLKLFIIFHQNKLSKQKSSNAMGKMYISNKLFPNG